MPDLLGFFQNLGWVWAVLPAAGFVVALALRSFRAGDFPHAFSVALLGSSLLSPQSFQYDLAPCLIPLLHFHWKGTGTLRIASWLLLVGAPLSLTYLLPPPWSALNAFLWIGYFFAVCLAPGSAQISRSSPTLIL
jgi:hypothetical protein